MPDRRTGEPADGDERSSPRAGTKRENPVHDGTRESSDRNGSQESSDRDGPQEIPDYGHTPRSASASDERAASGVENRDEMTRRMDDLAARVQALEGAVGALEAEEETIRSRADAALARTANASWDQDEAVGRPTAAGHSRTRASTAERPAGDRNRDPRRTDGAPAAGPTADHADDEWPAAAEVRSQGVLARLVEWL